MRTQSLKTEPLPLAVRASALGLAFTLVVAAFLPFLSVGARILG